MTMVTDFEDTFAGTNGDVISARTPDTTGAGYTYLANGSNFTATIQSNKMEWGLTVLNGQSHLIRCDPASAPHADQSIEVAMTIDGQFFRSGVAVRAIDASNHARMYYNAYLPGFELEVVVAGTATVQDTWNSGSGLAGQTKTLKLQAIGNVLTGYIDGVQRVTHTLTGGDATALSTGGRAFSGQYDLGPNHFDNVVCQTEQVASMRRHHLSVSPVARMRRARPPRRSATVSSTLFVSDTPTINAPNPPTDRGRLVAVLNVLRIGV